MLQELEPTIPGLHERMTVRTLRMLLENCVTELSASEANSWERAVEIFIEIRDTVSVLCSIDPRSNAAKLCTAIREGMDTDPANTRSIIDQHANDVKRVQFFVGLYNNIGNSLERLTEDREFMMHMGNCAPHTLEEIIARVRRMEQKGKHIIDNYTHIAPVTFML
jgi:hypothetical protein